MFNKKQELFQGGGVVFLSFWHEGAVAPNETLNYLETIFLDEGGVGASPNSLSFAYTY